MGKNLRSKFQVFDSVHNKTLDVDSQEEVEFTKWLCRANELGIMTDFEYQPKSFILSEKAHYVNSKGKTKTLFQEHIYTADFMLIFDERKFQDLADEFKMCDSVKSAPEKSQYVFYVDVKGGFQKDAGRSFSMNQKWVYMKYHVYVHKVIPKVFFQKFGIIEEFKWTQKTKKPSKKYEGYQTIEEIFNLYK